MSAETKTGFDWFQGQQQFWNQFTQNPMQNQMWQGLMNAWTQTQANSNNGFAAADYSRMFGDAGKTFLSMMESFAPGQAGGYEQALKSWMQQMETFLKSGGVFSPGFSGQTFNMDPMGFMASMPGVGYTREKQEKYGALYQLWSRFQKDMQNYNAQMTKIGLEALAKFNAYVQNPPADAKPMQSLKDVFVKWVDISEELYAKYAVTEEYTKMYGATVNSLMEFKKKFQEMTDDTLDQLGVPSRREVDSLHKRVHELARENRKLQAQLNEVLGTKPASAPKAKKRK
jgi:class III poly(R)-hydroxyalkanoic acid synthase PhaE subunit